MSEKSPCRTLAFTWNRVFHTVGPSPIARHLPNILEVRSGLPLNHRGIRKVLSTAGEALTLSLETPAYLREVFPHAWPAH